MLHSDSVTSSNALEAHEINDPDIDLVLKAQQELPYSTRSYEELLSKYHSLVFHICYKMLGDRGDAEDMSQEVMLKVFKYLPNFERRSTFKTWIARISTNTCLTAQDKIKRNKDMKVLLQNDPLYQMQESKINTTKRDLDIAMQLLSPKERQILTLRYTANLKIEEIAEVVDQGLSATKMRLYRAQESLKEQMEAYQN